MAESKTIKHILPESNVPSSVVGNAEAAGNSARKRERVIYLDLLRIWATLCVILLHTLTGVIQSEALYGKTCWWFADILNSFGRTGVPLFFMISGFLQLNDPRALDIKAFYRKRLPRILIPLLFWNIVYYILPRLGGEPMGFADFLYGLLRRGNYYHLWFLYTLLGMYLIIPFLKRMVDACSQKQLWLFLAIIAFTGTIRPMIEYLTDFSILILAEPIMDGYYAYLLLGYILGKFAQDKKARGFIYVFAAVAFAATVIGNYLESAEYNNLRFNGGYNICHFLTASALFVLFKYRLNLKNARLCRVISLVSGATFGVYFIHAGIMSFVNQYLAALPLSPSVKIILNFLITAAASFGVMIPLSKVKYLNRIIM